jgi:hypothetical protein
MMRITLLSLLVVVLLGGADRSVAQEKVEVRGVTSVIKVDEVIFSHLTELNGKFKLRNSHLPRTPTSECITMLVPGSGMLFPANLHSPRGGKETVYTAGDYYFETGNLTHTAQNKTKLPLRVLAVEIIPKDWTAPTVIAPKQ